MRTRIVPAYQVYREWTVRRGKNRGKTISMPCTRKMRRFGDAQMVTRRYSDMGVRTHVQTTQMKIQ